MAEAPLKILIVDNHPLFLQAIATVLASENYDVRKAAGGLEAIDILNDFIPDIFFIDLIMPYISGEKLTHYIRSREEFNHSFIVILSGIAKETDKIDFPSWADAFIAKGPLRNMAAHINEVIDMYRRKTGPGLRENYLGLADIVPRHITKELLFSVKHLEVLLDNMQEGVIEVSPDNRIVYMNPSASRILETGEFSLLSRDLASVFRNDGEGSISAIMARFDGGEEIRDIVIPVEHRYVRISILRVADSDVEAKIIFLNDVTSFKEKEESLEKALSEKEMLMREVHHRVKNNLNVISGLLTIQSMMIEDENLRNTVLEIQPRLQSISLVHDKLYNTGDLTNVDISQYLGELALLLLGMMGDEDLSVQLKMDVQPVRLGTDRTVALGLICTEIITNAVKYGFYRGNPEGNVLSIDFSEIEGELRLSIRNNGQPFPEKFDPSENKKLGFQVINLLVEQIHGRLEIERKPQTGITVIFPKP